MRHVNRMPHHIKFLSAIWPKELFNSVMLLNNGAQFGFAIDDVTVHFGFTSMSVWVFDGQGNRRVFSNMIPDRKLQLLDIIIKCAGRELVQSQLKVHP
jgi:hypothetical protein